VDAAAASGPKLPAGGWALLGGEGRGGGGFLFGGKTGPIWTGEGSPVFRPSLAQRRAVDRLSERRIRSRSLGTIRLWAGPDGLKRKFFRGGPRWPQTATGPRTVAKVGQLGCRWHSGVFLIDRLQIPHNPV